MALMPPFWKGRIPRLSREFGPQFPRREWIDADKLAADLLKAGKEKVPDYALDCHTLKGKRSGKTKADFFREEQAALEPFRDCSTTNGSAVAGTRNRSTTRGNRKRRT